MTDSNLEDPNAPREAEKYDNPVASREYLLELLAKQDGPITLNRLISELGYDGDEERIEGLRRRLRAMERDGQAIRNRRGGYVPVTKAELVRGRVIGHRDGFGFMVPDEGGNDVFLSPRVMRALLHGDRAVVQVVGEDRRGRPEGALVEVIERANAEVVGRLVIEAGVAFVIPDNKRMTQDVLIPMEALGGAKDGQIVRVALVEQPTQRHKPVGKVIEVLGDHMSPGMEIDVAIRAHGIPHEWPEVVRDHVKDMNDQVAEADKVGRVDLRDVPLVTIDGADSKDLDDAVFCEPTPKGFRLLVAIADVSHYVRIGSALDEEGFRRGTSVYFPGRVVPMLPEILSNGLCSVNPDIDRLCLCAEMLINSQGQIIRSRFFEGVMRSHARLTYDNVAAMVLDNDQADREKFAHVIKPVEALHDLYKILRAERERRGAIDFDTIETKIVFGENRKIEAIVPYERNDAHKIIEECMIAANVAAGRFLARRKIPSLYRVHDRPGAEKIDDLRAALKEKGLTLGGGDKPTPADFNALIEEAKGRPDFATVQTLLLRSLKQAVYAPDNLGHFGLAHEHYAHFTSPIRRYPDLMVHRAIRHVLRTGEAEHFPYSHEEMLLIGEHCSNNERRADEATRDATDWLKCEFMLDKVGNVYEGRVASVLGFGLFVELKDFFVEGLLHITALKRDFYHFDPVTVSLKGERSGKTYSLNDTLRVRVARVDLDERKIDFMLPEDEEGPGADQPAGHSGSDEGKPSKGSGRKDDKSAEKSDAKSAEKSDGDSDQTSSDETSEGKSGDEGNGGGKKRRPRRRRRRKPQDGQDGNGDGGQSDGQSDDQDGNKGKSGDSSD